MTTTVYIWRSFSENGRNAAIRARRAAGQRDYLPGLGEALGGFGHVAMQVGIHYISWWPPEEAGSKYSLSLSLEEDTDRIQRKPDRSIRINNLNEEEMLSEWKKLSSRSFDSIYRNCCSVAACLLAQGWTESFDSPSKAIKRYWEMMSHPARAYWVLLRFGIRQVTIHSPGEVEEFAEWLREAA